MGGLDPLSILTCTDPVRGLLLQAVSDRAVELVELRDRNLAVEIANRVGDLFPRK